MNRKHLTIALASALVATVGFTGCKKKEEPVVAPPPPAAETTPAPAPAPAAAPFSIVSVDLGNAVGADNRVTTAATSFARTDTIHASVNTSGDGAGKKLGAKWTYQDGQTVHEESRDMAGADTIYEFRIANPKGWPVGKYKVDVTVDGASMQAREFDVK